MKYVFLILFFIGVVSCAPSEDNLECESNEDCPSEKVCNLSLNICENIAEVSDYDQASEDLDVVADNESLPDADAVSETPDIDNSDEPCTPGTTKKCAWIGSEELENVGICKAGTSVCGADARWTECTGQVNPEPEACTADDIDSDCNGEADNLPAHTDADGDGFLRCEDDACDISEECPGFDPAMINPNAFEVADNGIDDNSNGEIDEVVTCDSSVSMTGLEGNGEYLAKAMDICEGYVSATISLAGEADSGSASMPKFDSSSKSYAVANKFGNSIMPARSSLMTILSSGDYDSPTSDSSGDLGTASKVPSDWMNRQKNCEFPGSEACGETISTEELDNQCTGTDAPSVQDPVMLTVKVKVPINANAFSFDFYFLSIEFPGYVCSAFNDFFIALLDSTFNDVNPDSDKKNNWDKNMAVDDKGNPMGVNIAPNGIFRRCNKDVCSGSAGIIGVGGNTHGECNACEKPEELKGTGFESETGGLFGMDTINYGGTGWFSASGNVVPGEEITLRFAIWDGGTDHIFDSTVLLDNFKWYEKEVEPGISPK